MKKNTVVIFTSQLIKDSEPALATFLRNHKKLRVILCVATKEDKKFYDVNFPNKFDEIKVLPNQFDVLNQEFDQNEIVEQAKTMENILDSSIYRVFLSHRVVGSGFFSSGGFLHPTTRLTKYTNHFDKLRMALAEILFWKDLFENNTIEVAVNVSNAGHSLAKKMNIPSLRYEQGRFENSAYWTMDDYRQPDNLSQLFNNNREKSFDQIVLNEQYKDYKISRKIDLDGLRFIATLRKSALSFLMRIYGRIRGYRKGKNIFALSEFLYIWRKRSEFLRLKKMAAIKEDNYINKKYIFFPLLAEPEIALHGIAQDFFFQLSAINMLSRDLPADYTIIVKEHILAIGRRPRDFYGQILSLKNVQLADPLMYGLDFIKKASAVACITGTAGWEAAVSGVPVISFSKNNGFNVVDHVFVVREPDDTKDIIKNVLNKDWPSSQSIKDGARLYNTVMENSFNRGDKTFFISWKDAKSKKNLIDEDAKLLGRTLLEKLGK